MKRPRRSTHLCVNACEPRRLCAASAHSAALTGTIRGVMSEVNDPENGVIYSKYTIARPTAALAGLAPLRIVHGAVTEHPSTVNGTFSYDFTTRSIVFGVAKGRRDAGRIELDIEQLAATPIQNQSYTGYAVTTRTGTTALTASLTFPKGTPQLNGPSKPFVIKIRPLS